MEDSNILPEDVTLDSSQPVADKAMDAEDADEVVAANAASDFPEGGTRAWLVVAGHTANMFATWGYVYNFGVFQSYYERHQLRNDSPSSIGWIGSLSFCFMMFGYVIGGPMFDRFGGTMIIAPATIVYTFAIMMTSLCDRLWQFILAQGLLQGIALGCILGPSTTAPSQYFKKKRGAAMGVTLMGSALGGVIFPVALNKMLQDESLGFGWSVRICGFIVLVLTLPAAFLIRARVPPRKTNFLLLNAFTELPYLAMLGAIFFAVASFFTPVFYLPSYAIQQGMSERLAQYLIPIMNAASLPGRLLPGILADKIGALNILILVFISTAIILFCWEVLTSHAGIIVWAAFFGFASGGLFTAGTVAFQNIAESPRDLGTYLGMAFAIGGLGALMSPPINGALIVSDHGGTKLSVFNGVFCMAGLVCVILAKLAVTGRRGLLSKG